MRYFKFIILFTLFLASCTCLKSGFTEEACLEKLQEEIKNNWVILEDIGEYFPVTYQRNDAFCNRVCSEYAKCLLGKKNRNDIKKLFGERGISIDNMYYYHIKNKSDDELMCFQFIVNASDTLTKISYRTCKYDDL